MVLPWLLSVRRLLLWLQKQHLLLLLLLLGNVQWEQLLLLREPLLWQALWPRHPIHAW